MAVNGYVYEIVGGGSRYIGSTYSPPEFRFRIHKSACRRHQNGAGVNQPVYQIIQQADCVMNIVETVTTPVKDYKTLRDRERHHILNNPCVNQRLPNNITPCEHNKPLHMCVDCGGTSICQHRRIKYQCVDCHGAKICEHRKQKKQCGVCTPRPCPVCHKVLGSTRAFQYHMGTHAPPRPAPPLHPPPQDGINALDHIINGVNAIAIQA
jgi:hypothetical protein